ncbi:MAG: triacylglycerol lipase [Solirubrobacteraceae bacterium]|nr:triacylglycerol lipase [Solirubrobacteraceae bacterium]
MSRGTPIRGETVRKLSACAWSVVLTTLLTGSLGVATAAAVPPRAQDPFYSGVQPASLGPIAPGTVLDTRIVPYHIAGLQIPLEAVQLSYRSTGQLGQPTMNVTTVVRPILQVRDTRKVISYQSFYDSLNPDDEPSYAISGGKTFGGAIMGVESALVVPFLLKGYTVVIPDIEGQDANFAAGPEYGYNTLDSLRAAVASQAAGIADDARIGLFGYSGGAIGTGWAAELAPNYAPDIDQRLVGAAMGGVLVRPATNLHYIDGSQTWAGVMAMAVIGVSRSFDIDLSPYLSEYGLRIYDKLEDASIAEVLGAYPGLTWKKMAKPEYETPEMVPLYVGVANKLIMGSYGTPTTPLLIGQGAKGELEGTQGDQPGIGAGDGVMVTGDVRAVARKWCAKGTTIEYRQFDDLSHIPTAAAWIPQGITWLERRFTSAPAPENCADIEPGNSLDPIPVKDPPAELPAEQPAAPAAADPAAAAVTSAASTTPPPIGTKKPTCGGKTATIVGTSGRDVITGTRRADVIVAGAGADTVRGGGGNDLICGGDGNDTLAGDAGKDRLWGGFGRDGCAGGPARDRLAGCERRKP